jgi:hypothetical protein
MSRNLIILLVVLSAGVAGLVVFSKMRSTENGEPLNLAATTPPPEPPSLSAQPTPQPRPAPVSPGIGRPNTTPPLPNPPPDPGNIGRTTTAARATTSLVANALTSTIPELSFETKPLPVLEKDYLTTTNRDTRLDIMMDIAENSSAETVKALTRLFEAESDTDLKIDLLDSLLGIEGFTDEKLIMLTLGARQGLSTEVRQSAIDGLIDLDDRRVIPVLNGLLNDPDEEIREGAKDALEMIQAEPLK